MKKLLLLPLAALVASCGLMPPEPKHLYAGPTQPVDKLGVLSEGSRGWLHVVSVDGQHVVDPVLGAAPHTKGLLVPPGSRRVKLRYMNFDKYAYQPGTPGPVLTVATSEAEIMVDVVAGHSYVLRGQRQGDRYRFWFDDKGLGYNPACLTPELYGKKVLANEPVPGC